MALTMLTQCLYGVTQATIEASPALGFIHTGNSRSFVFDIADLYKFEIALPLAFEIAKETTGNIELEARTKMREIIHQAKIPKRIIEDVKLLLLNNEDTEIPNEDVSFLWDDRQGEV